MISLILQNHHTIFNAHSSSLLLLFLSNISAYLCPCHNFYLPSPSIPGSKRNQEESGDGGKVASVEEGVGNAQEPCAETEIYHKEKTKEYVHRFYFVESSVLRPERPQPGTTKRQFLAHFTNCDKMVSRSTSTFGSWESREFYHCMGGNFEPFTFCKSASTKQRQLTDICTYIVCSFHILLR